MCVIKRLTIDNAELMVTADGLRKKIADFSGEIVITRHEHHVSLMGKRTGDDKKILASLVLCGDVDYRMKHSFSGYNVYDAVGNVHGEREDERLTFSGMHFEEFDPVTGEITFQIPELGVIHKMLLM